jgi:hypothetical protein
MSRSPQPATDYQKQIATLEAETRETLKLLRQMAPLGNDTAQLSKLTEEYLRLLTTLVEWSPEQRSRNGFEFIQKELVPRRNTAGELVRNWLTLSESALAESERNFSETRQAAGTRLLLILAACLLVGGLVARFGLRYSDNLERETARQFEEVVRAKFELQQLSARLLEIQEDERKRLSRELHDEIGQTLTALRIEISHAYTLLAQNAPAARERLDRARELAERSVRTVRDISLLLRPSLLDDLGLSPALQSLAEEFTGRTGIPCDIHEDGLEETLPEVVKTCVYRVVQEALEARGSQIGAYRRAADRRSTDRPDCGRRPWVERRLRRGERRQARPARDARAGVYAGRIFDVPVHARRRKRRAVAPAA